MSRHRERMGPERPGAVALLVGAVFIGGYRWTLPGEADWLEYVLRFVAVLFALACLIGAYELWRMGRPR